MRKLVIVVTEYWCHPEFGGTTRKIKEFDNLDKADKYYYLHCHNSEYDFTTVDIVEKEVK